jgi:AraC family transcriptional regulator
MTMLAKMPRQSPITLGDKIRSFEVGGFVFTETAHKPNQTLPRHSHEQPNIAFILDGSFTEILNNRTFECGPQSLIVKPAGEAHANQYGRSGMHCLLIEARPQKLESLHPVAKAFNRVNHVRGAMLSRLAIRIYHEMLLMDSASLLAIEGLSLELMAELSRHPDFLSERRLPRWLQRAKELLHAQFSEPLSLATIAKTVGVHPVHLAREFRKFYGCTPGEYLRALRIEFACRMLSTSHMPLIEVSLAAGFSHQAHFSRLFKRQIGMTPAEFRSLYRLPR